MDLPEELTRWNEIRQEIEDEATPPQQIPGKTEAFHKVSSDIGKSIVSAKGRRDENHAGYYRGNPDFIPHIAAARRALDPGCAEESAEVEVV